METIDIRLIIVQATGFLILFWILKKYLFGRIMGLIKDRENEIKDVYSRAGRERDDASELK